MKRLFSIVAGDGVDTPYYGGYLTQTGFFMIENKKSGKGTAFNFKDFQSVKVNFNGDDNIHDFILVSSTGETRGIDFSTQDKQAKSDFVQAVNHLVLFAKKHHPFDCTAPPPEYKAELDAFTAQTSAWRALATKPAPSDELTKKRLLAEDAVDQKDLDGAADYYNAGLVIDPTWASGWFNLALLYAEQRDYGQASFSMKHYLILLPNAPDAAAAKDKMLLWEAKAEEAAGK